MVTDFILSANFAREKIPHLIRLKKLTNRLIRPSIPLKFENKFFEVKTITDVEELSQVLKLRYKVFHNEFSGKKINFPFIQYDIDMHDFLCDHLVVKDKNNNNIIACYRLLPSALEKTFNHYYSETEFELSNLLALPGNKLELGRACVHKEYRTGAVITLLWKGICEYAKKSNTKYLFGCTSIKKSEFSNLSHIHTYLKNSDAFLKEFEINVKKKYQIESHPKVQFNFEPDSSIDLNEAKKSLNSILTMYLYAGAKVAPQYAYDAEFECLDLLTLVDFTQLPPSFERRFSC